MHKQIGVNLKTVLVDKKIAPLVQWLNGFEDCFTEYSCQGLKPSEKNEFSSVLPYIKFTVKNFITLKRIGVLIEDFNRKYFRKSLLNGEDDQVDPLVSLSIDFYEHEMSFSLYFKDQKSMLLFSQYVLKCHDHESFVV